MENIFDIIKALTDAKFEPSIQMPEMPDPIGIDQIESDHFEKINQNIWSIWDKYDTITKKGSECSYSPETKKESKWRYYLDSFFAPSIVAIAVVLIVIFKDNICVWQSNCDICWCNFVTLLIILLAIIFFAVFCYRWKRMVEKNYEKNREQGLKERNDYIKKLSDVFEFQLSAQRRQLNRFEFNEQMKKILLDEYARDKEHLRKMDLKKHERISTLFEKIIELGKIKNTVTLKDPRDNGKTITIERSILSNECSELKDIIKNFSVAHDDCCEKILKCLFGDPMDCEKVKKILGCLICNKDNETPNSDIVERIDRLIALIQTLGATGLQQVVNIGGKNE